MIPIRTAAVVLRQFYLMRGSLTRLLPLVVWVGIDIVMWGFLTKYLNSIQAARFDFVPVLLGAVLMWDFFTRIMHGVIMACLEDVWARNFLNFFASPLTVSEYVMGLIISSILTSAIGLAFMLVLASTVFGLDFFAYGIMFIPFLLLLFMFGISIGIFGCSLMLRFGPAAEWFVWPLPALISPFAGVFYPVSTLPQWMQVISGMIPPSYVFEGMRALVRGEGFSMASLMVGFVLAVVYIVAAWATFVYVHRRAVRTGLIARYSAENIS